MRPSDQRQLRAYVKALQALEAEIDRLNDEKALRMREAQACGFDKAALKYVLQCRRDGNLADDADLLSVYMSFARTNP